MRIRWYGKQVTRQSMVLLSLAMESLAVNIWSTAKRIVPVDTGSLKSSIRIKKYKGRNKNYILYRVMAGAGTGAGSGMRTIGRAGAGVGVGTQQTLKGKSWRQPFYALYVELGTVRMKAQPFMRPAFNKHKYKFKSTVRRILNQGLRKPGAKSSGWVKKDI
jgi:HK97 gp10 family phage protein